MTGIDYIGFDIHKKTISFCAKALDGTILGRGDDPGLADQTARVVPMQTGVVLRWRNSAR